MDIISLLSGLRLEQEERLDRGEGSVKDVRENLSEMQRINDVLGGTLALTRHLYPRLLRAGGHASILDVGTGGAGLPVRLARWGRSRGLDVRVIAIDRAARSLAVAADQARRHPEVTLLQADARRLPVGSRQVDFVISSLFLHHLSPGEACQLLRESYASARRSLVMSDLVRGWMPYLAFYGIAPVFARNSLTRSDGALSVLRAYTPDELRALAAQAGLRNARVFTHFPWRMTLVADK